MYTPIIVPWICIIIIIVFTVRVIIRLFKRPIGSPILKNLFIRLQNIIKLKRNS